jgi:hypothetical protein
LVTMYTKTAELDPDSEHWAITDGEPVRRKDEGGIIERDLLSAREFERVKDEGGRFGPPSIDCANFCHAR